MMISQNDELKKKLNKMLEFVVDLYKSEKDDGEETIYERQKLKGILSTMVDTELKIVQYLLNTTNEKCSLMELYDYAATCGFDICFVTSVVKQLRLAKVITINYTENYEITFCNRAALEEELQIITSNNVSIV